MTGLEIWCGKRNTLNKEKIRAYGDIEMVLEHGWQDRYCFERGNPGRCGGSRVFPFDDCNVWPVNNECTLRVSWGDGTISNVVVVQNGLKLCFVGSPNLPIQFPCRVRRFDLAAREHFNVFGDCGK